jgi:hypothetical protein
MAPSALIDGYRWSAPCRNIFVLTQADPSPPLNRIAHDHRGDRDEPIEVAGCRGCAWDRVFDVTVWPDATGARWTGFVVTFDGPRRSISLSTPE